MEKLNKQILTISLGSFLLILSSFALAQMRIGTVVASSGSVYALNQIGQKTALHRNSPVFLNDVITTESNGKIHVKFNDDTYVSLQPSSKYSVSDFKFANEAPKNNKYVGNILQGALVTISGQGKAENYKYNSPLAIIGVRGTGFAMKIEPKQKFQDLLVFRGYVAVSSIRSKQIPAALFRPQTMLVGIGQKLNAVTISNTGQITKLPRPFTLSATPTPKGYITPPNMNKVDYTSTIVSPGVQNATPIPLDIGPPGSVAL